MSTRKDFHRICLPIELEREICQFAVSSFLGCAPRIILVARRFHDWFKPELYRIIISTISTKSPPVLYSLTKLNTNSLNREHLGTHGHLVRYAFFGDCAPRHIVDILSFCPNIENIALRSVKGPVSDFRKLLLPALEDLAKRGKLKHLGASLDHFISYDHGRYKSLPFASLAFSSITHLVLLIHSDRHSVDGSQVANMHCLTHLAVLTVQSDWYMDDIFLGQCKHLRLLVLVRIQESGYINPDNCVVTLDGEEFPAGASICLSEHWERGVKGEADLWSVAEERHAKKLREEISGEDNRMVILEMLFTSPVYVQIE